MDLISREYRHVVGIRIYKVLGSKYWLNDFDKRVSKAQHTGLTRMEISICKGVI